MSWLGKLFGTDNAVNQVINTGKELLDDAFYTDAEKAEDIAADRSEVRTMLVGWMQNTQGQNLSRRVIALSITGIWLLMFVAALLLRIAGIWATEPEQLLEASNLIDGSGERMTGAVMLILAFYFAAPKLGDIADAALARFGKEK